MRVSLRLLAAVALAVAAAPAAARVAAPFPAGFRWGAAISGFQSDMGLDAPNDPGSDWWAWVHDPANVEAGRVSGDVPEDGPGFWTRYAADAKLAKKTLKLNAFRFGIEWSRIFPTSTAGVDTSGGIDAADLEALDALADQAAVAHYRDVLAALRARRLDPLVTVNHFSLPLWVHEPLGVRDAFVGVDALTGPVPPGLERAGWLDAATVVEFEKLCAYVGWKLGDLADRWATLNEPVVVLVSGYLNAPGIGGNFPPGVFNFDAVRTAIPNLVMAHARGYDALHANDTVDADGDGAAATVGIVHNMGAFHPANPQSAADVEAASHATYLFDEVLPLALTAGAFDANLDGDALDEGESRPDLADRLDWFGVNYYNRITVTALGGPLTPLVPLLDFIPTISYRTPENPNAPECPTTCTEFGWEIYPEGLGEVLAIAGGFGLPIYVTENGIADADDDQRARFVYDHLAVLQQTIADGTADVRGYYHWSLTDNFEWSSGYYPRFGLARYDPASGKRRVRKGATVLRTIAKKNGITRKLQKRFGTPE
ncbi:MAG TPA: glycoside hydrolase family 1 protein [Candidatus Limnocylindria bacterium]|nr:glycoside hydrolase family 1 protein [Candidatus Limnocylindria bacterium]